jgi:hypothetical protein
VGLDCGPYSDCVGAVYCEEVAGGSGRLVELAQDSARVCVLVCSAEYLGFAITVT